MSKDPHAAAVRVSPGPGRCYAHRPSIEPPLEAFLVDVTVRACAAVSSELADGLRSDRSEANGTLLLSKRMVVLHMWWTIGPAELH